MRKAKKVFFQADARKRLLEKLNVKKVSQNSYYINQYKKCKLISDTILVECNNKPFTKAETAFVNEYCRRMQGNNIYCAYEGEKAEVCIEGKTVTYLNRTGKAYKQALAKAGHVVSIGYFSGIFIKKEKQLYAMYLADSLCNDLRRCTDLTLLSKIQRNLLMSNQLHLSEQSLHTLEHLCFPVTLYKGSLIDLSGAAYPERSKEDGRKTVFLYAGGLEKNGITTALTSLLNVADHTEYKYYIVVESKKLDFSRLTSNELYTKAEVLYLDEFEFSFKELLCKTLFYQANLDKPWVERNLSQAYERVFRKYYGYISADVFVQFTGYVSDIIWLYSKAPCRKVIYVHNDMEKEIESKGFQHRITLSKAYGIYDCVVPVTEDILPSTMRFNRNGNYVVGENCHDYIKVIEKSEQAICFDEDTKSTHSKEELQKILDSDATKIITIGRFSKEKGHAMLIQAFTKFYEENKDSYLIIIGGYGNLYKETLDMAGQSAAKGHIVIIRSVKNPMPILKQCDLFILSSLYEGLGLTLLEADTLGIPVISTDIEGPRGFLNAHGGTLVPLGVEGLYEGMLNYKKGKIRSMDIDYSCYNKKCCTQFYRILGVGK